MGFFKDARKGMKDAKDLGNYHGGMPSVRGAFKDISALADDRGEGEILKNGIPAKGVVKGFTEPVQGDRFAMHIPIEVHPPEGEPYVVDHVFSSHCLEHIKIPFRLLGEISRVCKDGAKIEFWTPYAFSNEAFLYGHEMFLTEEHWMHFYRETWAGVMRGREPRWEPRGRTTFQFSGLT